MMVRFVSFYLCVSQALHWTALYYIFPAFNVRIAQAIGTPPQIAQHLFAYSLLACAFTSPFTAALYRRYSAASVLSGANVAVAFPLLLLASATRFNQAAVAAILLGMFMSVLLYDGAFVAVSGFDSALRSKAIGWIVTGGGIATAVAIPALVFADHTLGWRVVLVFSAIGSVLFSLAAAKVDWHGAPASPALLKVAQARALRRFELWAFGLAFGITNAVLVGLLSVLLPLIELRGFSEAQCAWVAACWGFASLPARLLTSLHSFRPIFVANAAFLSAAMGFILLLGSRKASVALGLALFGVCAGLLTASRSMLASEYLPYLPFETSNGILATFSNLFRIFGPVLAAYFVYSIRKPNLFLVLSAAVAFISGTLVNATCIAITERRRVCVL